MRNANRRFGTLNEVNVVGLATLVRDVKSISFNITVQDSTPTLLNQSSGDQLIIHQHPKEENGEVHKIFVGNFTEVLLNSMISVPIAVRFQNIPAWSNDGGYKIKPTPLEFNANEIHPSRVQNMTLTLDGEKYQYQVETGWQKMNEVVEIPALRVVAVERYLHFTKSLSRSIPLPNRKFLYPAHSIESDMYVFQALFSDICAVFELTGDGWNNNFSAFLNYQNIRGILQKELYWTRQWKRENGNWIEKPFIEGGNNDELLKLILKTMRNAFAHTHRAYVNLSAEAYFNLLGLSGQEFNRLPEAVKNAPADDVDYPIYLYNKNSEGVDSVIQCGYGNLRYHLHLILLKILTPREPIIDIFGNALGNDEG